MVRVASNAFCISVTPRLLLLEALSKCAGTVDGWETFARSLAAMHRGTRHDRFGWPRDGYLGRLRQVNLRERLSTLAHFGAAATTTVTLVRETLAPFYPRR
jgi:fructosamine-3-kinase